MTSPLRKLFRKEKTGNIDGVARCDKGHNRFVNPRDFDMQILVEQAEQAIDQGVHPKLIAAGSSGSYFVRDKDEKMIGVFKPKDEEPFAPFNPKWPKYFQRMCCPCCFGRGCILENQGYVSETAASMVDEKLGFEIVPKTRIVYLTSNVFYYSKNEKRKKTLPPKVGSLQVFMHGYKDAGEVMSEWIQTAMPTHVAHRFLVQFQKLVVLDYIVRNTDRSPANWLIKLIYDHDDIQDINVAAIDHGLCFPHKHPDEYREYPFYWSFLPIAHTPFLPDIKRETLALLDDVRQVETLCLQLLRLFKVDASFSMRRTRRLVSVMRGQMFNLRRILSHAVDKTPYDLAGEPRYMLTPKLKHPETASGQESPPSVNEAASSSHWKSIKETFNPHKHSTPIPQGARWEDTYYIKQVTKNPYFANCC